MPFFNFHCNACSHEHRKLTTLKIACELSHTCPECQSGDVSARLGAPAALGKETSDEYRGKSVDQNLKEKIQERNHAHFVKNDLPKIIEKQGKEFAIRQGFIDEDGRAKPKK